jgi:TRAP-type C4-dicarboxylate transport system permease small subunit
MTLYQVIARLFGFNAAYTEEIANYSFIWMAFIGSAICIRSHEHFSFDALTDKLKGNAKRLNNLVVQLILLAFNCIVAYYGVILTIKFWSWKFSSLPFVSLGLAWICIPIYGVSSIIYTLENIYELIKYGSFKTNDELVIKTDGKVGEC